MRLSLRKRVFLLVAAINVAVFTTGWVFASGRLEQEDERLAGELNARLASTLRSSIRPEGNVNAARILQWPGWDRITDAILIDGHVDRRPDGRIRPLGVFLNPVGAVGRDADFERDLVLASILQAVEERRSVAGVQGGWAVPIEGPQGVWGGCWYRTLPPIETAALAKSFLWGFVVSTLLLTAGTFLMLRRLVLDPVNDLVGGARRVRGGDFSARLVEPARRDELADLVRGFNEMTATVQGFNERLAHEVEQATAQARRAEQEAMTQRRLAAMGELAAGIAHEINNPLGGLQNAVEALERSDLPAEKRERYLELLGEGLRRIERTVGQLLRFTPRDASTEPVDLSRVCRDALGLVQHRAEGQGTALELTVFGTRVDPGAPGEPAHAPVPPIVGSRHELGQAVLNLLVNALDALESAGGGGRVAVAIESRAGRLLLRVEDDGPGASAEELERAPDLFHTTKEVGKGTGLGLSIVHSIVSSHGGTVTLESPAGGGFRVEILLPLGMAPEGAAPEAPAT